jgi:hypothetical protein
MKKPTSVRPRPIGHKIFGTLLIVLAALLLIGAHENQETLWTGLLMGGLPLVGGGLLWWSALRREWEWKQGLQQQQDRQWEKDILKCARRHDGKLTPADLALETSLSLDEARKRLEALCD